MSIASRVRKKSIPSQQNDSWSALLAGRRPLEKLYSFEPIRRIAMLKEGAPALLVTFLTDEMAMTKDRLYRIAGVARATIDRKIRAAARLNQDESERMMGIALLIGQAEKIVSESGDSKTFEAGKWIAAWLDRPLPSLGGVRPATLMDTAEGRELVSNLVARMQSGAYA